MPITEELLDAFLEEHQIEDADDLELFSDMIHLLFAEPNVPLLVLNWYKISLTRQHGADIT